MQIKHCVKVEGLWTFTISTMFLFEICPSTMLAGVFLDRNTGVFDLHHDSGG